MNVLDLDQRSPEWLAARRGMITSTRIASVCSFRKDGKESAERRKMKLEIIQEIVTGKAVEHYVTPAMEFGLEHEAIARTEYENRYGYDVQLLGFVLHPELARCGASPDGIVKPNRFVEFKVPNTMTHLEYIADGIVPVEYIPQMQWQMACAGPDIEVCDFVSFDPRLPEDLQLFVVPLERDEKKIAHYEQQATIFLEEVVQLAEVLKRNVKHQTLADKLRTGIRNAKGQYTPEEMTEVARELVP